MELKSSLPRSQELATCPYPEPDKSFRALPFPISVRLILMLSYRLYLGPPILFPLGLPT